MTTANDLIKGALKDLGVLERTGPLEGQEALDVLELLNQMCSSWIYDDIDLEWLTLELNDVVPYPEDHIGPIRYNLAVFAAPSFDATPSPYIVAMANQGYKQLQRAYLDIGEMGIDAAIHPYYNPNGYYANGWNF